MDQPDKVEPSTTQGPSLAKFSPVYVRGIKE